MPKAPLPAMWCADEMQPHPALATARLHPPRAHASFVNACARAASQRRRWTGVSAPQVKDPDSALWFMFYEGVAPDGARSVGLAASQDGRGGWATVGSEPVLAPADADAWDSGSVGAPCAVAMSAGRWRLYYSGRRVAAAAAGGGADEPGCWKGVGLALSPEGITLAAAARDGGEGLRFRRRTGPRAAPGAAGS